MNPTIPLWQALILAVCPVVAVVVVVWLCRVVVRMEHERTIEARERIEVAQRWVRTFEEVAAALGRRTSQIRPLSEQSDCRNCGCLVGRNEDGQWVHVLNRQRVCPLHDLTYADPKEAPRV